MNEHTSTPTDDTGYTAICLACSTRHREVAALIGVPRALKLAECDSCAAMPEPLELPVKKKWRTK